ncbi:hypothetical protein CJ030_MR8G008983 [Morella rubra]|uniref:Uncharacterized protein n=1 Tax=Morella rubra TaxID=262757 RepID=A0A6A1URP2_9ROSI|nr:hypothetical protein CJ030_MR8G008983 [Morella rubra]
MGFVGVKAFKRLVSGQASMRFEGGICREDLKNLLPVESLAWLFSRWVSTNLGGETMANRAKRQRAVAPCPSSPPPIFNNTEKPVGAGDACSYTSTLASGDFETRASSQPTLAPSLGGMTHSSTGSTSNSGWRSRTCGLVLDKVQATRLDKLSVSIPDNCAADVVKDEELQEQAISDGRSYNDIDILHQVLGPKPGYVRGLGRAVKPPRSSGLTSTSVARQLREAQLEIDRLKAKQEAEIE